MLLLTVIVCSLAGAVSWVRGLCVCVCVKKTGEMANLGEMALVLLLSSMDLRDWRGAPSRRCLYSDLFHY